MSLSVLAPIPSPCPFSSPCQGRKPQGGGATRQPCTWAGKRRTRQDRNDGGMRGQRVNSRVWFVSHSPADDFCAPIARLSARLMPCEFSGIQRQNNGVTPVSVPCVSTAGA